MWVRWTGCPRVYGESNAAAPAGSAENFSHFCVRVAREAKGEPREIRNELLISLWIDLVGHDVQSSANLPFEMLDPFLREISHVACASERLTEIDQAGGFPASNRQQVIGADIGLDSANHQSTAAVFRRGELTLPGIFMRKISLTVGAIALLAGCGVSTQQEVQMGQEEAQQVNAQLPMVQDAVIQNYVNALGQRIARTTSRADLNWQFQVVNSDVVNAFALPGGFVYVNRGVLERASNMSEVAGVIGHEIEHVVRRHSVKQMEQAQGANVGLGIACALTGICNSGLAQAAINIGGTAVFAKFSRSDEIQADEGGFNNVMRAGISPRGMYTFFQKLLAEEQNSGSGGSAAAWFSDHPGTQDRIADIQRMLSQVPASQLNALQTNDSGFATMKARLARLGPAPKAQGQ
jgi:predicted Zn-dependent protease